MSALVFQHEGLVRLLAFAVAAYFPFSAPLWLTLEKKAERLRAVSSVPVPATREGDSCSEPSRRLQNVLE
jgi:hypothetical protein